MEKDEVCEAGISADSSFIDCNLSIEYLNKSLSCTSIDQSPIANEWISSACILQRKTWESEKESSYKITNKVENPESKINDPDSEILLQLKKMITISKAGVENFKFWHLFLRAGFEKNWK